MAFTLGRPRRRCCSLGVPIRRTDAIPLLVQGRLQGIRINYWTSESNCAWDLVSIQGFYLNVQLYRIPGSGFTLQDAPILGASNVSLGLSNSKEQRLRIWKGHSIGVELS